MLHRLALLAGAIVAITSLAAQLPARTGVPRLWTAEARNRGPEEIARYGILVTVAEDGRDRTAHVPPSGGPRDAVSLQRRSDASLEEWFDPARLRDDYVPKGWNPPDTRARPIPGHRYGLNLVAEDKAALIAFLKTF